ncbi:hypothetical protein [Lactobacillus sp. ESL0677]|uniref:hypothetical protein n=1 Tax=Lactobacillus sp. ESL0677 TaxID=2983208 RepID=UPI0023F6BE6B|nr:hypothetical protein [Lactobacillus sp. ESL0677]WEV37700.1 hypothetical protein OZX76_03875 [Lactobacillus sp. ESL0677]
MKRWNELVNRFLGTDLSVRQTNWWTILLVPALAALVTYLATCPSVYVKEIGM